MTNPKVALFPQLNPERRKNPQGPSHSRPSPPVRLRERLAVIPPSLAPRPRLVPQVLLRQALTQLSY
ncbi:hypothetical protein BDN71DRAFT_745112 [Pleurotus eryngii]|uniref:Uncharacterized protein n=1 Tax=Pleurotus eryngii TaxID=5323 RepID=A0A9P5ZH38_PLEER|nr:hypothetical protein BDN71DRAFT_745112 [Pleurotus eryngii]